MGKITSWLVRRRGFVILGAVLAIVGWWFAAYPRGMAMAWWDGLRGRDVIKVYGMIGGPARQEYERLLGARYGVEFDRVAGCVVTTELVEYADGYNRVSMPQIRAKWGKDVFTACSIDAHAAEKAAGRAAGVEP